MCAHRGGFKSCLGIMTGFNFIDGQPHDSIFTDFQTLNKFNLEQFSELISILFHFLSDPSKNEWLLQQIEEFSQTHSVNTTGLQSIIKSLILVPNGALKKNLSGSQINEDLTSLGLSNDRAEVFVKKWNENIATMSKAAQAQTLTVNQLIDMDWKFGGAVKLEEAILKMKNFSLMYDGSPIQIVDTFKYLGVI
ncbi:COMM domain-containing protein 7 [Nymphon striatum]|nr:COMM domain-containing protein 7 [Nymphon striatum]